MDKFRRASEAAKPLYHLINAAHKAMINMALLILDYMPWAVIALLANTIAQRGLSSILEVGKFIIALCCSSRAVYDPTNPAGSEWFESYDLRKEILRNNVNGIYLFVLALAAFQ